MKRGEAWEEQRRVRDRYASSLVIAAAIIAAVRLAREPEIWRLSPRVVGAVSDSISLSRLILTKVLN